MSRSREKAILCFKRANSALLDRKPAAQSKKRGAMKLVNIMFDLYFRLNNYRLCAPLTKVDEVFLLLFFLFLFLFLL